MWLYLPFGFYSVVAHREDRTRLIVRARVRKDLEALVKVLPAGSKPTRIVKNTRADYLYRFEISRVEFARAMLSIAMLIDYPNFKNEVARAQGSKRASVYHDVWSVTSELDERSTAG